MTNFFPSRPAAHPTIYAYEDTHPQYRGLLKVGYTSVDVQHRVAQQYPTLRPGARPYRIVFEESAMRGDGTSFTDHEVHRVLRRMGVENPEGEWFRCTVREVRAAVRSVRERREAEFQRTEHFAMRPEQEAAVEKTCEYSVPAVPTTTVRRISSGIAKCVSAKPSRPTSWHAAWDGNGCWS